MYNIENLYVGAVNKFRPLPLSKYALIANSKYESANLLCRVTVRI